MGIFASPSLDLVARWAARQMPLRVKDEEPPMVTVTLPMTDRAASSEQTVKTSTLFVTRGSKILVQGPSLMTFSTCVSWERVIRFFKRPQPFLACLQVVYVTAVTGAAQLFLQSQYYTCADPLGPFGRCSHVVTFLLYAKPDAIKPWKPLQGSLYLLTCYSAWVP